ncbi:SGNH/GDSL hydrolase family protein [Indiicoccus explosivorum]|uniref:SGNH/GDSL hydrolase family protein n=1 Tax=Indiicoccus explosivorum TaxID=1917864 RepID=UPI000B44D9AE|nr:SGNH/GDSL hydrolase family protein [Indiicoccus explosivorum]
MKLRVVGTGLTVVCCSAALAVSYLLYQQKIELPTPMIEAEAEQPAPKVVEPAAEAEPALDGESLEALTANMDVPARELFLQRASAGEKVKLLVTGSDVMMEGGPGYAARLKDALEEAYAGLIEVKLVSFSGTSKTFTDQFVDLSAGYDVVLLEPFTLENNGVVTIEEEHAAISAFMEEVKTVTPDAELILHPPQPLFGANYYLTQVSALEEFAAAQDYGYIDHWSAWPSTDDEALKEFVTDSGIPNGTGAEVWADELAGYFIAD